jgi:hypothetical protein
MTDRLTPRFRLLALGSVVLLIVLIWLYVREFPRFSNTIGVGGLVLVSVLGGVVAAAAIIYAGRRRLRPWSRHWPEIIIIAVPLLFFAPLFGSLLNRAGGPVEYESFDFEAETPYIASAYGILKEQRLKPTGYYLYVRQNGRPYRFQYSRQPYYPITRDGEKILLPVRSGLLGFRVVVLN